MKLNAENIYDNYAFCRNPIRITGDNAADSAMNTALPYDVAINNVKVFEGRYYPPFDMNLADIAESYMPVFAEPDMSELFSKIMSLEALPVMKVAVTDASGAKESLELRLMPGGVSKRNLRRLNELAKDSFTHRFLNRKATPFLSVRNNSWRFVIGESELLPLYFLVDDNDRWVIRDTMWRNEYMANLSSGLWSLNITLLRKQFAKRFGALPSSFDVYRLDKAGNMVRCCSVVVEESICCRDRTLIKFRNSYGVFELLDLTGIGEVESRLSDDAENRKVYDKQIDGFMSSRDRTSIEKTVTVGSGVKCVESLLALEDMIASEEVYLLASGDSLLRAIPSIESMTHGLRPDVPVSVSVKFSLVDYDGNITPEIISGSEGMFTGTFAKEFAKEFD